MIRGFRDSYNTYTCARCFRSIEMGSNHMVYRISQTENGSMVGLAILVRESKPYSPLFIRVMVPISRVTSEYWASTVQTLKGVAPIQQATVITTKLT